MRAIGWTLALFLIAIAALDPLCCADGCTRRDLVATGHSSAGPECPICLPGFVAHVPASLRPFDRIAGRTPVRAERLPFSVFHKPLEHPPRA
jgi:hypothetical protein